MDYEDDRPLTTEEAMEFVKLGKDSFNVRVRRGEIPHAKIGKRNYFRKSDLLAWLETQFEEAM